MKPQYLATSDTVEFVALLILYERINDYYRFIILLYRQMVNSFVKIQKVNNNV